MGYEVIIRRRKRGVAGGGAPATPLPQQASLIAWWSGEDAAGADGASVASWTDRIGNVVAAQGTGGLQPIVKANQAGGKRCVRFPGTAYLPIATPGAIRTAINGFDYTLMIVARAQGLTTSGSVFNNTRINGTDSFMYIMDGTYVGQYSGWQVPFSTLGKVITFGTTSKTGTPNLKHTYVDGGVIGADAGTGPTSETYQFSIGGWADGQYKVNADIFDILIWNKNLTVAEVMQFQMWACERYGRQYPWANFDRIFMFDGDSLTAGLGATSRITTSYPAQMAYDMALPYGAWHNIGMSSQTMATIDSVAYLRVDGIPAVTGKDVSLCVTEWYNNSDKIHPAPYNAGISYLTNRKAASSRIKTIFGTSTDSLADSSNETNRTNYNNAFDTYMAGAHPLIDAYAALHNNASIGGTSSYSTNSGTLWADTVHLNDAGYTIQKGIFKTGVDALMSGVPTPATPTLSRNTTTANPRASYTVTPTGHVVDDVLRFKRILSGVTTYVDYVITAADVGGPVTVVPWAYLEDGAYTISVQHFHGGKPSAFSTADTVTIAAPQVVITPNSLTAVQSTHGTNVVGGEFWTGVPLTSGKRNLFAISFYNTGSIPTQANTTVTIGSISCTCVAWAGTSGNITTLWLMNSNAINSSDTLTVSYPGQSAFLACYGSWAVDNFIGLVSEIRGIGLGSGARADTVTVPNDASLLVVYLSTGGAPTWTWTGNIAGPDGGFIYCRHKNSGAGSESYSATNGGTAQTNSFTLRSS